MKKKKKKIENTLWIEKLKELCVLYNFCDVYGNDLLVKLCMYYRLKLFASYPKGCYGGQLFKWRQANSYVIGMFKYCKNSKICD